MEPAGVGGGPSQGKGHGGLSGCLSVWPCLPGTQGSEKRLPGQRQGSLSRWGLQVSLPASLCKVRFKMRRSHRCSRADCWLPCLGRLSPPVLLERRDAYTQMRSTEGLEGPGRSDNSR